MKPYQKDFKIMLINKGITFEQFYMRNIYEQLPEITLASFRNMFYGKSKMKESVKKVIESFSGE